MSFNASSINLEVLLNTLDKAEQFIKKFANGYLEKGSVKNPSIKIWLKSSDWKKNYNGLKQLYQSEIIPDIESKMREKIERENPSLSAARVNLILNLLYKY